MYKKEKFENFLESLKGNSQDTLIESVKKGFQVCFESVLLKDIIDPNNPSTHIRRVNYPLFKNIQVDPDTTTIEEFLNRFLPHEVYKVKNFGRLAVYYITKKAKELGISLPPEWEKDFIYNDKRINIF